jgi:hypothetical protein
MEAADPGVGLQYIPAIHHHLRVAATPVGLQYTTTTILW